uniref:Uncharacterized protein n=1 Tax=Candidatus Kentrum eta TaxID=2126337 RepID=A0A450VFU0_9GAMM|nr:MAG: hypothetical protein BECKH772B_GA0070898_103673 [Candidatus Kentron sp. H]
MTASHRHAFDSGGWGWGRAAAQADASPRYFCRAELRAHFIRPQPPRSHRGEDAGNRRTGGVNQSAIFQKCDFSPDPLGGRGSCRAVFPGDHPRRHFRPSRNPPLVKPYLESMFPTRIRPQPDQPTALQFVPLDGRYWIERQGLHKGRRGGWGRAAAQADASPRYFCRAELGAHFIRPQPPRSQSQ